MLQAGTRARPELTFAFVILFPGELSKQLPTPDEKKKKIKVQFVACGFFLKAVTPMSEEIPRLQ